MYTTQPNSNLFLAGTNLVAITIKVVIAKGTTRTAKQKMATMSAIKDFTVEELCEFLSSYNLSEGAVDNFRTNRICGTTLFELDTTDLKELLPLLGDRKWILSSYQPTVSVSYNLTSYVAHVHFMQLPTTPLPTSAAVAHAGTSWISSCIPDTFSRRTREGIAKGVVTRGQRIELRVPEFPSSSEYIDVCQTLIEKYPTIKDTVGNGYVSVYT